MAGRAAIMRQRTEKLTQLLEIIIMLRCLHLNSVFPFYITVPVDKM